MAVCTTKNIEFTRCHRRKVQANFGGGEITSDGGVMLLKMVDKILKLTSRVAENANDPRHPEKIKHTILSMFRQRVYGLRRSQ